ncbi:hypothetical protein [Beduini massiliensis]|uniref:hypothetical protein n=1 Tax=Beduini massiliensis TaxID=1585974 RepID=UPI00059A7CED|nr:hypothetical protein [Beduini massiliensis]
MLIKDINQLEEIKMIHAGDQDKQMEGAYIGDLLSIVMSKAEENQLWLTVQAHLNALAVATLVDMAGILFVEGTQVDDATLERAKELNLPLYTTHLSAYEAVKKLIALGI